MQHKFAFPLQNVRDRLSNTFYTLFACDSKLLEKSNTIESKYQLPKVDSFVERILQSGQLDLVMSQAETTQSIDNQNDCTKMEMDEKLPPPKQVNIYLSMYLIFI